MNLFLTVFISLFVFVHSRTTCAPRDFKHGTVVCVCNSTYCDDLDPLKKPEKGYATVYETSKDGDRFKDSQIKFGDKHNDTAKKTVTISVDIKQTSQKILGFGGSHTDATGVNIKALPTKLQEHLINDFYSDKGLEYSMSRVPIGGTDFSSRPYSYDDDHTDDFDLKYFNLTVEDHDYKIPYMQMAVKASPHKMRYFGSPWAPPAWMKTNGQINHGGFLIGKPGEKYYKTFALYFIKFLDAYKANNLTFWGITIENEPKAGNDSTYGFNSLGFTPELERDFIKMDLGPALAAAGYGKDKLNVMIFDDQRDQIFNWANIILKDKEASSYVTGTAYHYYNNNPSNVVNLQKTHDLDPTKFILATEAQNAPPVLGNWAYLEKFADDIIVNLNNLVTGWIGWNMVLSTIGGPRWEMKGYADAPIIVNSTAQEYYKQPDFYGMGHFSKFIPPDSIKVKVTVDVKADKFECTAFQRPDGLVTIVALNQNDEVVHFNINDTQSKQQLSYVAKARSIQTYVYNA